MPEIWDTFEPTTENYLNWVNNVGRGKKQRRRTSSRKRAYRPWGCALPSSALGAVLLIAMMFIVQ